MNLSLSGKRLSLSETPDQQFGPTVGATDSQARWNHVPQISVSFARLYQIRGKKKKITLLTHVLPIRVHCHGHESKERMWLLQPHQLSER